MSVSLTNPKLTNHLLRQLGKAKREHQDAVEKLSSGSQFTSTDPRPADRAISEKMEFRMRGLAVAKRNANDVVSMMQTAEGGLSEVTNIVIRMKELTTLASSTSISDRERRFSLIEYEALHEEVDRIALSTEFNGIPLLNGDSDLMPEVLSFRVGDAVNSDDGSYKSDQDVNTLRLEGLRDVVATTDGLGLKSARDYIAGSSSSEGVSLEEIQDLMETSNDDFPTTFDAALNTIATQRAVFGAMQSRLHSTLDYIDVYQENIAAAKSNISDADYAQQAVKLAESAILTQATSGLMSQLNFEAGMTLNLLTSLSR